MQKIDFTEKFESLSHNNLYINKCSFEIAYTYLKLVVEYVPGGA